MINLVPSHLEGNQPRRIECFIESEGRSEPAGFEKYGDAQRESFKSRVLNMAPLDFGRVVQEEEDITTTSVACS
ncbi:WSSV183 [White spot syndrome virus]|uniref:WSSV183 n=1 Tax=White spot syndrome virus TaxID=342409 RepID=A0A2I6SBT9_9VIRU|nr:WSSV183 [White spot syndrome virus]